MSGIMTRSDHREADEIERRCREGVQAVGTCFHEQTGEQHELIVLRRTVVMEASCSPYASDDEDNATSPRYRRSRRLRVQPETFEVEDYYMCKHGWATICYNPDDEHRRTRPLTPSWVPDAKERAAQDPPWQFRLSADTPPCPFR